MKILVSLLFAIGFHQIALAADLSSLRADLDSEFQAVTPAEEVAAPSFMDEFDPHSPDAEEILSAYDQYYESVTGQSAHLEAQPFFYSLTPQACQRLSCPVWIRVNKTTQTLALYLDSKNTPAAVWPVSTGLSGHSTPNFDTYPNGRIYDQYTSGKYPGGDYKGLGNMPYAVFISGGFALHGTPASNWPLLGKRASHGCIRMHPDMAKKVNRLVRQVGIKKTWITVE